MSRNSGAAQLDSLVSLIRESVEVFKAECNAAGVPVPVLDDQSFSESDGIRERRSGKLSRAAGIIEAACAQLCAVVVRPELTLLKAASGHTISACMQVVSEYDVATILLHERHGLRSSALAKSTGVDEDSLSRILRLLSTIHIFQEVEPGIFANNMVSARLATSQHTKAAIGNRTRESFKASPYISEFLKHGCASLSRPMSPFQLAYGLPLMDYHLSPDGKDTVARFMAGVTGWGETAMSSDVWHSEFPWPDFLSKPRPIEVCDVGAGEGQIFLKLAKAFPGMRFRVTLQDRPPILELSKQIWSKDLPEAIRDGRVDFISINFFAEAPVPNCDIYYIRHCMHNWPDDKCVTVLRNIARAMSSNENSILLVHEIVLRPANRISSIEDNTDCNAPAPLLKNFGAAKIIEHISDITMLALLNSKERTLGEYRVLGAMGGLALDCVWNMEGCAMMQFSLANRAA